ncbi:MAG: transglycosylase SLT domain-containing protein [Pseudomonadota bacterium]
MSIIFLIFVVSRLNAEDSPKHPVHSLKDFRSSKKLTLCNEIIPLDNQSVWEMLDREFVVSVGNIPQVVMWLKRSKRYFPYIEAKLREKGLPEDLKYLPVIESNLLKYSYSSKSAVGVWQFIEGTAEKYNLRVDEWFDERRNFFKSTDAALNYLDFLYKTFNSWSLAFAAYNCGEERVEREIERQGVNSYYKLNLPLETERFIFRILAAKIILSNPENYGYYLDEDEYYNPIEFDEVLVDIPFNIHLRVIAEAANSFFKEIKELNPEIQGYYLPPGKYLILIPKGNPGLFKENLQVSLEKLAKEKYYLYTVKEGDNLTSISKRFNVEVNSLEMWNNLKEKNFIYPGQKLKIYKEAFEEQGM